MDEQLYPNDPEQLFKEYRSLIEKLYHAPFDEDMISLARSVVETENHIISLLKQREESLKFKGLDSHLTRGFMDMRYW